MVSKSIIRAACACLVVVSFNVNAALVQFTETNTIVSPDISTDFSSLPETTHKNPVSVLAHVGVYIEIEEITDVYQ